MGLHLGEGMVLAVPASIDAVETLLAGQGYVAARPLATVVFLGLKLGRPLFLEGEAGVGKTEIAKVLSARLPRRPLPVRRTGRRQRDRRLRGQRVHHRRLLQAQGRAHR